MVSPDRSSNSGVTGGSPVVTMVRYTHKGWLGLAPIYTNEHGNDVMPRHWVFDWWLDVNIWFTQFLNNAMGAELPFCIKITGVLDKPIEIPLNMREGE